MGWERRALPHTIARQDVDFTNRKSTHVLMTCVELMLLTRDTNPAHVLQYLRPRAVLHYTLYCSLDLCLKLSIQGARLLYLYIYMEHMMVSFSEISLYIAAHCFYLGPGKGFCSSFNLRLDLYIPSSKNSIHRNTEIPRRMHILGDVEARAPLYNVDNHVLVVGCTVLGSLAYISTRTVILEQDRHNSVTMLE